MSLQIRCSTAAPRRGRVVLGTVRYHVLGPLEIVDGDRPRALGSPSQRLILAALLAHRGSTVTTQTLIDAIWDDPPTSAIRTLRSYVSRLRQLTGDELIGTPGGYRLDVAPSELDSVHFESQLNDVAGRSPHETIEILDDALGRWRGPAFADTAHHPLVLPVARRLDELRLAARESRLDAMAASGAHARVVADAEELVGEHPHREGAWLILIGALLAERRAADATRAVSRARQALADLGLEPSEDLRQAELHALGVTTAPERPASSPMRPPVRPMSMADAARPEPPPRRSSAFFGRDELVREVADLLHHARLVTLVGPGGVGKTRLANEVAAAVASRHRHGCKVIDLGVLTDDDEVTAAIVSGLGLITGNEPPLDALVGARSLDVVLIVDNADHVIDQTARAVGAMTSHPGPLRVLVTSRERLGTDGEHVRAVRPLPGDGQRSPARELFRDRARALGHEVGDGDEDERMVATVVDRLDGLPLAIEMAAAQLTSCTLPELVELLHTSLDELRSPARGAPSRHRSLAELLDWSLTGLEHDDATSLHHLCVFAGSFTSDDVAGVLGRQAVPATRRLADRSLVRVDHGIPVRTRTSFRILQLVREHAVRRFGPVPAVVQRAHAQWCLEQARVANLDMATVDEPAARLRLSHLIDDLRAAHRWASVHDRHVALGISAAIHRYAVGGLNDELLSWADRLLAGGIRTDDPVDDVAVVMASAAVRSLCRGDFGAGDAIARRGLALASSTTASLPLYEAVGDAALYEGRTTDAAEAYRRLADDARELGELWYRAVGDTGAVLAAVYGGSETPTLEPDDLDSPPSSLAWLAYTRAEAVAATDPVTAIGHCERALEQARLGPSRIIEGVALVSIASLRHRLDGPQAALPELRSAIGHWLELGDRSHQVTTLRNLALVFGDLGLVAETAELMAGVDSAGVPTYGAEADRLAEARSWIERSLSEQERASAESAGRALDVSALAIRSIEMIDVTLAAAHPASPA